MSPQKIIVVGGGPAGIAAALRARELGADVTLLERELLGGVCFNEGPAPVRTLSRAARVLRDARLWSELGLEGPAPRINVKTLLGSARSVARHVHDVKQISDQLVSLGIDVREGVGAARFLDPHRIALPEGPIFEADRIIIAAGGHGRRLPIPGNELGLAYHDVWALDALPARIVVVGGAATGCQLASVFADFGAEVTLLEAADRLVPVEDIDVSRGLRAAYEQRGITVETETRVERLTKIDGAVCLTYAAPTGDAGMEADAVFFAVGWDGNLDALDLGAAGVAVERAHVPVDTSLRTTQWHIFAVGDVNGIMMLAQTAAHQGRIAAENAVLDTNRPYCSSLVAAGSFTDPEYASIGLTEVEARRQGDCVVAVFPHERLTRAVVDHRPHGFCKLIADRKTGRLVGAHVLGEYSAETIQVAATAMAAKMSVLDLARVQFAYPTFTQGIALAALQISRELGLLPTVSATGGDGATVEGW